MRVEKRFFSNLFSRRGHRFDFFAACEEMPHYDCYLRNHSLQPLTTVFQYFLSTPMTLPWISTVAAGTMIGFIAAFDGCSRIFSPSR